MKSTAFTRVGSNPVLPVSFLSGSVLLFVIFIHTRSYCAGAGFVLFFGSGSAGLSKHEAHFFEMLFRWIIELGLDIPAFFALHRLLSSTFCDKIICWVLAGIRQGGNKQPGPASSVTQLDSCVRCSGSRSAAGSGLQIPLAPSRPDLRSRKAKNGGSAIPIPKFFRDPDVKNTSDPWIPKATGQPQ